MDGGVHLLYGPFWIAGTGDGVELLGCAAIGGNKDAPSRLRIAGIVVGFPIFRGLALGYIVHVNQAS